jgi:hypothetical protein
MSKEIQLTRPPGIVVVLDGHKHKMRKPKAGKAVELESALREVREGNKSAMVTVLGFLVEHGMPADVANDLELELVEAIFEALMPEKKRD